MRGPDLDVLQELPRNCARSCNKIPGIVDIDSSYEGGLPELQVHIDRQKAADLGVSVDDIAQTMRTMVQGDVVTRYREGPGHLRCAPAARGKGSQRPRRRRRA